MMLLHNIIAASPHRRIAASPHRRIAASPHRRIAASPHRRIAASPHRRIAQSAPSPTPSDRLTTPPAFSPARRLRSGLLQCLLGLSLLLGLAAGAHAQATLSISGPASANEGNSGTRDLIYTVSLSQTISTIVSWKICFTGTATRDSNGGAIDASADYQAREGNNPSPQCTPDTAFGTGFSTSSTHVKIRVKGDTDPESDETVIATLSIVGTNPGGVTLGTSTHTHTILNDDTAPVSTVNFTSLPYAADEGDPIAMALSINPTRSVATTVGLGYADDDADNSDYTQKPSVIIPANTATHTFSILTIEDTTPEADESFTININSLPAGVQKGTTSEAIVYIDDDDTVTDTTAPRITSITRQTPSTSPTDADTLTWRITFNEAVAHVDKTDFTVSGTTAALTVAEVSSTTYTVTASGGNLASLNGPVTLGFATNQDIADTSGNALANLTPTGTDHRTWTVNNTVVRFASATYSVNEGEAVTLTLQINPARSSATTVGLNYIDTDTDNNDYTQTASVTLPANQTSHAFTLPTAQDDAVEGNENFVVQIDTLPTGIQSGPPDRAMVTIRDDDTPDTTAPQVTSITVHRASTTAVTWRVVFDEAVINVDATDFTVAGTTAALTVAEVSSTTYDVTARDGDLVTLAEGTVLTLRFDSHDITDASGNALGASPTPTGTHQPTWTVGETVVTTPSTSGTAPSSPPVVTAALRGPKHIDEGHPAVFTVSLNPAPTEPLTLHLKIRETSPAGANYVPADNEGIRTLSFAPGQPQASLHMATRDNGQRDPDDGTVIVTLVPSTAYRVDPAHDRVRVVIRDTARAALPTAGWLVRFARTVADQALEGITRRLSAPRAVGWAGTLSQTDSTALSEALGGAGIASTEPLNGGTLALWGRGHRSGFDGRALDAPLDGTVDSLQLGLDYARNHWLTGVTVLHGEGDGHWQPPDTVSGIRSTVTAVVPYGAWTVSARQQVWGALGTGEGTVYRAQPTGPDVKADLTWQMLAAGTTGDLTGPGGAGQPALSWRAEALWSDLTSKATRDLLGTEASITRLRAALDSRWTLPAGTGQFQPQLAAGIRHDGGDAENGFGLDLAAGITWTNGHGLAFNLSGRTLLHHEHDDFKTHGVAASAVYDPQPASARGPSLTVRRSLGRPDGNLETLFSSTAALTPAETPSDGHWAAEAAWGLPSRSDRYTARPHLGITLGAATRDLILGWRWTPIPHAHRPAFAVRALHRNHGNHTEQILGVEITAQW